MSITFDLTGSQPDASSMTFEVDGLRLDLTSGLFNGDTGGDFLVYENSPILKQTTDGVGMLNPYGDFESHIDGHGKKEVAIFAFSQAVEITGIGFTPIGTSVNPSGENVSFMLFRHGLIAEQTSTLIDADGTNDVSLYGQLLGIGAHGQIDGFRITSITVDVPVTTTQNDSYGMSRSELGLSLEILDNDRGARSITSVNASGLVGTVTIAADGQSLIYTKGAGFGGLIAGQSVTETFTTSVLGWDGVQHTETVSVTIKGAGGQNFITGTSSGNKLAGTALGDTIDGLAGADTLNGGAGDDVIYGGAGKDKLDGQSGADELIGGADNDSYYVDDIHDVVLENSAEGTDTVYSSVSFRLSSNVEKLYLTGNTDISAIGNELANTLVGNDGANVLEGGSGKDSLNGGLGADIMIGGNENDSYTVDDVNDAIIEYYGGGLDTVTSSINYVLGDQVEYLKLSGSAALNGTGNASQNIMTGNSGANVLTGLAGNDKISGGLGTDTIIGGVGKDSITGGGDADTFVFAEAGSTNYDSISDFVHGQDKIALSASAFGLQAGALSADAFAFGTAATTAFQHILYDQAKGDIWYDADGNGAVSKVQIATLTDGLAITSSDFVIL